MNWTRNVALLTALAIFLANAYGVRLHSDMKKLVVLTQQEEPYYPPPVNGYPSAVFEISLNGSIRLMWNGTLEYGTNICAYAAPATDDHLLYVLQDSGTLLTIDTTSAKTVRTQAVSNADPPRWFTSLDYDAKTKSLYGICNASYGWPDGRQLCRINLNVTEKKAPLDYVHKLPAWEYYSNEAVDCLFDGSSPSGLFWYIADDHIIRGINVHDGSLITIGFANPLSLNYDFVKKRMFDIKKLDNVFQPFVISQVILVPPNTTTPPNPPEVTVTEMPKNLSLISKGMSVIDSEEHVIFALMTDKPNEWSRPVVPNSLVAIDVSTQHTTVQELDFSPYSFLSNEWRFSRLFII